MAVTTVHDPAALVARTIRLPDDIEVLDVMAEPGYAWLRPGLALVGQGEALRIAIPRTDPAAAAKVVSNTLVQIEVDGTIDNFPHGPIALGALPFDRDTPGHISVPELLVGRTDSGNAWATAISPGGRLDPKEAVIDATTRCAASPETTPSTFDIHPEREVSDWCEALRSAREELRQGFANKVVLARSIKVVTDQPISHKTLLKRLRSTYPSCMVYAIDDLIGASPELLVARDGNEVRSHPMAGTAPRSDDPVVDAQLATNLKASDKDLREHRFTIDMVHETLLPWCSWLDEEAEPSLVTMANVRHLATLVQGHLSSPPASVIELMTALHPTPAVCGTPRPHAVELIKRHEVLDRGRYAGPVGWVNSNGDGEWAVAIRCAQLDTTGARLMAGVGVVADSDATSELAETRAKLQALLGAIVRP